jgi:chromosome segregation ATPase
MEQQPWIARNPVVITALVSYAFGMLAWGWHISEVVATQTERDLQLSMRMMEIERHQNKLEEQIPLLAALTVRITTLEKENDQQNRRVDAMDTQGTRMLATVENRQNDVLTRLSRIEQFVVENNKRLDSIEQAIRTLQTPPR